MAMSHAGHNHPATPAARAACRKSNGNPSVTRIESDGMSREIYRAQANQTARRRADRDNAEIKMTGDVARRMARHAAKADRIQPRRSGARVSPTNSTCIQAALHTGRGLCACGHVSGGFVRAS